jgi:hypothetical protein
MTKASTGRLHIRARIIGVVGWGTENQLRGQQLEIPHLKLYLPSKHSGEDS